MRGSSLLLLLLSSMMLQARGDIFHYYKLKKFITAIAFARALGRRPTILPIPIPIPIPMSQNEVIRIPANRAKSFMTLTGSPKYVGGYSSGGTGGFTGSSSFGYPLPGSFDTLSGTGSNIMVLDSNSLLDSNIGGSEFASPSNVIRLVSGKKPQRILSRPSKFFMSGGNGLMRNSDLMDIGRPPMRHFDTKSPTGKRKKPIPVGERFRLPSIPNAEHSIAFSRRSTDISENREEG